MASFDDFTFDEPMDDDFPSFEDEMEAEAEIEREAAAKSAVAAPQAGEALPPEWEFDQATPTAAAAPAVADAKSVAAAPVGDAPTFDADEPADGAMEEEEEVVVDVGPPREVRARFMVPLEVDGRGTSRELRLLEPRARATRLDAIGSRQLLSRPISEIREAADRQSAAEKVEQAAAAEKEAAEAAAKAAKAAEEGAEDEEVDEDEEAAAAPADVTAARASAAKAAVDCALWVEKWRPRAFMDLLSDERVNRHVLRWVKQWDSFVFGGPSRGGAAALAAARQNSRPERPIMLISGPPGLGKTTLAHIVARHAGYRPDEINASDERSAKVLKQRVAEATEVQAVFNDTRPPMIIIDEIDGAMGGPEGTGAVNELIKLAQATVQKAAGGGGGVAAADKSPVKGSVLPGKKREKKTPSGLLRPVICICNDLHAPALRPLRAVAELVEFRSASNSQLLARLKNVCRAEHLKADAHTLQALAALSGNDVRTCLNTLQFVSAKAGTTLTEDTLENAGLGKKSVAKSPLQLWRQVFVEPPRKQRSAASSTSRGGGGGPGTTTAGARKATGGKGGGGTAAAAGSSGGGSEGGRPLTSTEQLLKDLELADVPRVLDGVVENYLSVQYADPSLTRTAMAADALADHDLMNAAQFSRGHFGLMGYAKTTVGAMHTLCAVPHLREQLVYPKTERDVRNKRASSSNLLKSWHAGLAPSCYQFYSGESLLLDVLSPLLTILTPPIRPAAINLLASDERKVLAELIDRMLAFGLRYTQSAVDEGGYAYRLDPPLADLLPAAPSVGGDSEGGAGGGGGAAGADGAGGALVRELPAAVRQLLGTELQREMMRRHHAHATAKSGGGSEGGGGGTPGEIGNGVGGSPFKKPAMRPTQLKPVAKPLAAEAKGPVEKRDMFGRVVTSTQKRGLKRPAGALGADKEGGGEALQVRFKYHEGVTDAVRRPVKVRDLL